ncbi:hypothetical protein ACQKFO_21385 [Rossellomorea sp. NPDC071047]|uniref:hypothetical protein n=1 Tax=Rossellomorea sp. NPDC071047 TaxID=3390675 RepID=UPI003D075537
MTYMGFTVNDDCLVSEKASITREALPQYILEHKGMPVVYLLNEYGDLEITLMGGKLKQIRNPLLYKEIEQALKAN